ncbi:MAG: hypothetical protein COV47_02905 [Candidatus Diapherotrites archaeon CG11_big_fil_rev_8_21_14_0_20_37_9]|nr:MAG: hypothetical protein COV47_02905 [Candidatus Diapherotrites archaeon CG11_big_fil_rev_8_21_14_0_20_37_9]
MYLDTDIFYAKLKPNDRHAKTAEKMLSGKSRQATSIITLLELELLFKREISDELSRHTMEIFTKNFPETKIREFNAKIFMKSLELRQEFDLGIFDSIHAATAIIHNETMVSTDKAYKRVRGLKTANLI